MSFAIKYDRGRCAMISTRINELVNKCLHIPRVIFEIRDPNVESSGSALHFFLIMNWEQQRKLLPNSRSENLSKGRLIDIFIHLLIMFRASAMDIYFM